MANRYDVKVMTDVDPAIQVSPEHGEALVRIVAEAVRNAVRHGGATEIDLLLTTKPLDLTISDDGRGFALGRPEALRTGGFGLTSMRERASAIGAEFSITSSPGAGTVVRVTRP
jgi:signal transduction histidine kinase